EAGEDLTGELLEVQRLIAEAAARAPQPERGRLQAHRARLQEASGQAALQAALAAELADLVRRCPDRGGASRYTRELEVVVDRVAARFAAWYELFPRSQGSDPSRAATWRES